MTTERALELLHRISDSQFDGPHGDERREALSMAVRALEQNLVKESDGLVKDLVKDCISRKMAIDALDGFRCGTKAAWKVIEDLPSAQPTYTDEEIQRMQDLESAEIEKAYQIGYEEGKKDAQPTQTNADSTQTNALDCVSRHAAIDEINKLKYPSSLVDVKRIIVDLPSAQPERDIPIKPIETTDKAWGIPRRQAVCPKCDYYLGHVAFLGGYKGKRITYCETCGQAIDWEGWNFDE